MRRTSRLSHNGKRVADKVQSFEYRGKEYHWRVLPASLQNLASMKGQRIEKLLSGHSENTIRVLYYLVCWCGQPVTEDVFVRDWLTGHVIFRLNPCEKQVTDIYRTIRLAAIKYGL